MTARLQTVAQHPAKYCSPTNFAMGKVLQLLAHRRLEGGQAIITRRSATCFEDLYVLVSKHEPSMPS